MSKHHPQRGQPWIWWCCLAVIWLLATVFDRLWLGVDQRLPSWDQADYLNNAVDHGRALGLLAGGAWPGWDGLLDLSPKIPPLASLVSGTVMAVAGEGVDQASWVLALWQALLVVTVALWGRQLIGAGFGLLASALVCLAPALAGLRVDFTLDLPVAAASTLALWLLWRWQRPGSSGGHWGQVLPVGLAIGAALLIKQSALLVVAPPALWAFAQAQTQPSRRWQSWAGLAIVLSLVAPWLHHNWITTLSGTERAVVTSGAREGDPGSLDPRSLIWYPRLWPSQLGILSLASGLTGIGLLIRKRLRKPPIHPRDGWAWLIGCAISGWLCTSLSPNKDPRYITQVLPLLVLLLARGWWEIGQRLEGLGNRRLAVAGLAAGLMTLGTQTVTTRVEKIESRPESALPQLMDRLRLIVGRRPTTLLVLPSKAQLNQHTTTHLGRLDGGRIVGRQPSKSRLDNPLSLDRGEWFVLSSQRLRDKAARQLDRLVRRDPRFTLVAQWPQPDGSRLELWRRRCDSPPPSRFDGDFIRLARGMAAGPPGLEAVFTVIGPEHQLDGHFLYQNRVRAWAEARLRRAPNDREAIWSLTLLAILQNRAAQAAGWLARLEALDPHNPWPAAYRSAVEIIDWKPWAAHRTASTALKRTSSPVLMALRDLACGLGGNPAGWIALHRSLGPARQVLDP